FTSVLELIRTRLYTIKDFSAIGRPYFSDEFIFDEAAVQKNLKKDTNLKAYLPELAHAFETLETYTVESTENAVRVLCEKLGIKAGLLINAVRTAVTGQAAGPGLFELLIIIGREAAVQRIRKAVQQFYA
ncbi:MAG: glutamate--tRNA ligase, partial [Pseudomonadota bacterium]